MDKFLFGLIIFMLAACVAAISWASYLAWSQSNSPTFTLYKNQWQCVETQVYYTQTTTMVGKVMIPQTIRNVRCINYVRK